MAEKIKKYAIVVFLTFLVWAWAFNDLERTISRSATLNISKNPDSNIFVTFDPLAPIEMTLEFKGTPAKVNELINRIDAGLEDLKFIFNPENEKKTSPYTLNVLEFLHDNSKIKKLELSVVSTGIKNESVQVKVENLQKKKLQIKCVDVNMAEIDAISINPSSVEIFVREGFTGDAIVVLYDREITKAQKDYIIKKPFVELAPNDIRQGVPVEIKLPPTELDDKPFKTIRIGYSFGKTIMGKYLIKLENESELTETIALKATPEAYDAYVNMDIQIIVQALDKDEIRTDTISRDVIYNFPPKHFASGNIRLAQNELRKARFKLVKISPAAAVE